MQSLPIFVAEMRMLGIKRLEIELEPVTEAPRRRDETTLDHVLAEHREQGEGDTERPPKPEGSCAFGDCTSPREGLFGGQVAARYCRTHALAEAGVRT